MAIPYLACMALVASLDRLPPRVLPSIAAVEGGRIGAAIQDSDGSQDLGLMQVNTRWLPAIARAMHGDVTIARTLLLNDACFNISAAGAILRSYLDAEHGNLMQAIGDYHSHTIALNRAYQLHVVAAASRLFARPVAAAADHRPSGNGAARCSRAPVSPTMLRVSARSASPCPARHRRTSSPAGP